MKHDKFRYLCKTLKSLTLITECYMFLSNIKLNKGKEMAIIIIYGYLNLGFLHKNKHPYKKKLTLLHGVILKT